MASSHLLRWSTGICVLRGGWALVTTCPRGSFLPRTQRGHMSHASTTTIEMSQLDWSKRNNWELHNKLTVPSSPPRRITAWSSSRCTRTRADELSEVCKLLKFIQKKYVCCLQKVKSLQDPFFVVKFFNLKENETEYCWRLECQDNSRNIQIWVTFKTLSKGL